MRITNLFKIFCILSFLATSSLAFAALEEGLISAWSFDDGTAKDNIGSNNGKMHGGVEPTDGMHGKGMDFKGTDGYIDVPHDKSMEVIAEGLTASAWIYIRSFVNHAAVIFKGEMIGWTNNYAFRIATRNANELTWGVCVPGTEGYFHTSDAATPNEWYFVCLTADGTQATGHVAKKGDKVEIPPSADQSNPRAIAAPYRTCPDFPIEIGVGRAVNGNVGNDAYFDGVIDEIYIWDRALDITEIEALANGARPSGMPVAPKGKAATVWGNIKEIR